MYRWLATSIALMITSEALAFDVYECAQEYIVNFSRCKDKGVIDQGCAKPEVYDGHFERVSPDDPASGADLLIVDDDNIMVEFSSWDVEKYRTGKTEPWDSGTYVKTDDYGYQKKEDPLDFLRLEKADNVLIFRHYKLYSDFDAFISTYSCTLKR